MRSASPRWRPERCWPMRTTASAFSLSAASQARRTSVSASARVSAALQGPQRLVIL
jgi:hypothetical protein